MFLKPIPEELLPEAFSLAQYQGNSVLVRSAVVRALAARWYREKGWEEWLEPWKEEFDPLMACIVYTPEELDNIPLEECARRYEIAQSEGGAVVWAEFMDRLAESMDQALAEIE